MSETLNFVTTITRHGEAVCLHTSVTQEAVMGTKKTGKDEDKGKGGSQSGGQTGGGATSGAKGKGKGGDPSSASGTRTGGSGSTSKKTSRSS